MIKMSHREDSHMEFAQDINSAMTAYINSYSLNNYEVEFSNMKEAELSQTGKCGR